MPAPPLENGRVPRFIPLTADDHRTSAQACRVAAVQAEDDAAKQTNPQTARLFNTMAKRYRDLAEKHELIARVL